MGGPKFYDTGPRNSWTTRTSATLELDQAFFQITNGWSRGYSGCCLIPTLTSTIDLASIPGRVFAFITVRRTTSLVLVVCTCVKFLLYLWSAKIFEMKMSTQKMHIGSCFTKASCQLCCSTITVTQGNFRMIECLQITFQKDLAGCWTSLILANS